MTLESVAIHKFLGNLVEPVWRHSGGEQFKVMLGTVRHSGASPLDSLIGAVSRLAQDGRQRHSAELATVWRTHITSGSSLSSCSGRTVDT